MKLIVDAAMGNNFASLVVVLRGEDGEVVKAQTKLFQLDDSLVVEAFAVCLAQQLAKDENFQHIVVEGDSKICLDALNGDDTC